VRVPERPGVVVERARGMRRAPTPSERVLWEAIRARKLGASFRRQAPLGRYVADFVAPRERLVVEVDGGWHAGRRAADERRDAKLRRMGYRVLRLDAEIVLRELPVVVERVRGAFGADAPPAGR